MSDTNAYRFFCDSALQKRAKFLMPLMFDVQYNIPKDLCWGLNHVTLTFQAHPGHIAGPLVRLAMFELGK